MPVLDFNHLHIYTYIYIYLTQSDANIPGPNGRSLVEIQHASGANVQISKKGIFAPGTRNRIVTITGQPSAIAKAQFLIEQKINEEETKRARQIPLTTVVN